MSEQQAHLHFSFSNVPSSVSPEQVDELYWCVFNQIHKHNFYIKQRSEKLNTRTFATDSCTTFVNGKSSLSKTKYESQSKAMALCCSMEVGNWWRSVRYLSNAVWIVLSWCQVSRGWLSSSVGTMWSCIAYAMPDEMAWIPTERSTRVPALSSSEFRCPSCFRSISSHSLLLSFSSPIVNLLAMAISRRMRWFVFI